jgi:hypothetical protein
MPETSRRVAVTLIAATNEDAHQVMAGMLDAVRGALPGLAIHSTTTSAFDLDEDDEPEPAVQLVLSGSAVVGVYVDRPDLADERAREYRGVVVALPIETDHRRNGGTDA